MFSSFSSTFGLGRAKKGVSGGSGGGALLSGTIALGSGMGRYTTYSGTVSVSPTGIIREIAQTGSVTLFYLNYGTFGSYTIDSAGLNGSTNISITIDSVSQTVSGIAQDFGTYLLWSVDGDPFSIYDFDTHTISITDAAGAGGGGGDITGSFLVQAVDNKGMLYGNLGTDLDAVGIDILQYSPDANNTNCGLIDGTSYTGYTIEQIYPYRSAFYVDGARIQSITVTVGGVTHTFGFVDAYSDLGDPLNLQARVGQTLDISITFNQ